jgi:threonine aldolase
MNFASDNTAPAHPAIMAAVAAANEGPAAAYGADPWSDRLSDIVAEVFGRRALVLPVATGTAANALALSVLTQPWGAILCHREAHIETDECGAPEFFTSGAKLVLGDDPHAKLSTGRVAEMLSRNRRGVHSVTPTTLSISQLSERGCAYRPGELAALGELARAHHLGFHMDGARFANALAYLKCPPAEVSWQAGVDILCLGATKNGALGAEALIVFDDQRADELAFRRKRSGHLLCKGRFVAAQLIAYLENGLWLELATRANGFAQRLGQAASKHLCDPVEGNEVFIRPGPEALAVLRGAGTVFYDWGPPEAGEARLVVRYDQPEAEVDQLCRLLASL